MDRLEEAGIVSPTGPSRRNRVYGARAVLAALDAPLSLEDSADRGIPPGSPASP